VKDQADKLREMAFKFRQQIEEEMIKVTRHTRVVVVSSGKGGVGKSFLALNVSLNLCCRGYKVVLMDADLGLANIDIMLGIVPRYNLYHVIQGQKTLEEIIIAGPEGLKIIPGGSGIKELADLTKDELKRILLESGKLDGEYDYMVIDTGAGISKGVITFLAAADDVIIITTPEPTSMADAYSVVKSLNSNTFRGKLYLVVNRVSDNAEGVMVAEKMKLVCKKFLALDIKLLGCIADEPLIAEGIKRQKALVQLFPKSLAAEGINFLTDRLLDFTLNGRPDGLKKLSGGGVKTFLKRIAGIIK